MFGRPDLVPRKPSWGRLYALAALMLGILGVVDSYTPEGAWRRTLEAVVTTAGFAAMHLWVRSNRRAFDLAGQRDPGSAAPFEPSAGVEAVGRPWVNGASAPRGDNPRCPTIHDERPGTVVAVPRRLRSARGS